MSDAREWLRQNRAVRSISESQMHDALLAVLDLHEPVKHPMWSDLYRDRPDLVECWDRQVCRYCYDLNYSQEGLDDQPDEYNWPCSTVASINAALEVTDEQA